MPHHQSQFVRMRRLQMMKEKMGKEGGWGTSERHLSGRNSSNTGTSTTKRSAKSKQLALPLGVHLSQVSTKGKIPTCRHCRSVIERRGTWHAIQVLPNSTFGLPAAARNEYHYHCKCVMKVFQYNDIEQLIDIVNSKTEINGVDKNRIIDSINSGQD